MKKLVYQYGNTYIQRHVNVQAGLTPAVLPPYRAPLYAESGDHVVSHQPGCQLHHTLYG